MDVNRREIRDEEDEISQNETKANTAVDWSSVNLIDGVDVVLPTIDEYDRLYNLCGHDVDFDDGMCEDMHEDAITLDNVIELDDDIELENVRRGMITKSMLHYSKCHLGQILIFLLHLRDLRWVVFLLKTIVIGIIIFIMKVIHIQEEQLHLKLVVLQRQQMNRF